jgi:hypothetical protein
MERKLTKTQAYRLQRVARGDAMIPSMVRSLVNRGLIVQNDVRGYRRHEWGRDVGPTFYTFMLTEKGREVLASLNAV